MAIQPAKVDGFEVSGQREERPPFADPVMEMPRVLYYYSFPGGGIGRYTHCLISEISRLTESAQDLICLPEFEWGATSDYQAWPILFSVSHPVVPVRKFRFLISQQINPKRLIQFLKQHPHEIVHLQNVNHLTFAVWGEALRKTGVKVVYTAHDIRRAKGMIHSAYEERRLKDFYRYCDLIFAHGANQARDLVEYAGVDPAKIRTVPHGPYAYGPPPAHDAAQALRAKHGIGSDKMICLFFGYIKPYKMLPRLLKALARSSDALYLIIAGRGSESQVQSIRHAIKKLKLAERVTFIDQYIPETEVAALFDLADFVAVTYADSFSSQSGVLNIASYYHTPVLATPTACMLESVEARKIGLLTPGFETDDLAAGLDRIRETLSEGSAFEFSGYNALNSWEEAARLTVQAYRDLL